MIPIANATNLTIAKNFFRNIKIRNILAYIDVGNADVPVYTT
jgi:hypothetical protein